MGIILFTFKKLLIDPSYKAAGYDRSASAPRLLDMHFNNHLIIRVIGLFYYVILFAFHDYQ